jgi:hypothetical protein
MRSIETVTEIVVKRFIRKKEVQGMLNRFKFVNEADSGIYVMRESGSECYISREDIMKTVEAFRIDPSIYQDGPTKLRQYIKKRIYSPLWAIVRLLSIDEIVE